MARDANARAGRRKPKPKSIKSKAINMNSTRRLSRLGKRMQKGIVGESAQFMTRAKAVKTLQVSLRDFRRLCILKGIYPRDPKKKPSGTDKTYYAAKDIMFLAHEPLLERFRSLKTHMKKVRRRVGRKELDEAGRMYEARPEYTLEHLVRERYPRFQNAVADLDDALTLIHLFANLPSEAGIKAEITENCLRLSREWQLYVVRSRSLRKVFFSLKGVYYRADVNGQEVTWIVPHKFAQDMPREVDFRVMLTFLEFYQTLVAFVHFKLYHDIGLQYPPKLEALADARGANLDALAVEARSSGTTQGKEVGRKTKKEEAKTEGTSSKGAQGVGQDYGVLDARAAASLSRKVQEHIARAGLAEDDEDEGDEEGLDDDGGDSGPEDAEGFELDEQAQALRNKQRELRRLLALYNGLVFFLSRETPTEPLELCIKAFGGSLATNEEDPKITHFVTDRDRYAEESARLETREYVQPQWVFDSINARILLPIKRYEPGSKDLPPHLSPFVDDSSEGYQPKYAEELEQLRAARLRAGEGEDDGLHGSTAKGASYVQDGSDSDEEDDDDDDGSEDDVDAVEAQERRYAAELEMEMRGRGGTVRSDAASESESESESEADSDDEEEEEEVKAEVEAKSKRGKAAPAPASTKTPSFVRAKRWSGSKSGYVFYAGPQGVGYYLDKKPKVTYDFSAPAKSKRARRREEAAEAHDMARMMMTKKASRLYGRMQFGKQRKKDAADELMRKRKTAESQRSGSSGGNKKRTKR